MPDKALLERIRTEISTLMHEWPFHRIWTITHHEPEWDGELREAASIMRRNDETIETSAWRLVMAYRQRAEEDHLTLHWKNYGVRSSGPMSDEDFDRL